MSMFLTSIFCNNIYWIDLKWDIDLSNFFICSAKLDLVAKRNWPLTKIVGERKSIKQGPN